MRRIIVPSVTAALLLIFTAAAAAGGSEGKTDNGTTRNGVSITTPATPEPVPATEQGTATPKTTTPTTTTPDEIATPMPEASKSDARLKAIRDRASKMPAAEREQIEKTLSQSEKDVDVEAVASGDATVADRFATEFGMTSEELLSERSQYNVGWGDVMIAHTLLANAPKGTTADHLYTLHSEQMGWGPIAYGLGLRIGSVASAIKTETLVARGTVKADGKTPRIGMSTRVASAGGSRVRSHKANEGAAAKNAAGEGTTVTK